MTVTELQLRKLGFYKMPSGSWRRSLNEIDEIVAQKRGDEFAFIISLGDDEAEAAGVETFEDVCDLYRLLTGREL